VPGAHSADRAEAGSALAALARGVSALRGRVRAHGEAVALGGAGLVGGAAFDPAGPSITPESYFSGTTSGGSFPFAAVGAIWGHIIMGYQLTFLSMLGYAALALAGDDLLMLFVAASFEYFGVGLGTVGLTAFIARQTSLKFAATQFALLSSLTAVPRTLANASTGFIIEAMGYFHFYLLCFALALPGMLLLLWVAPWRQR